MKVLNILEVEYSDAYNAAGQRKFEARSTNPQSALSLIGLKLRCSPADTGRTIAVENAQTIIHAVVS
eukprot:m.125865 g.125865  ORF g.125865 m.125865 type:complete len:67 (-) comp17343_c0_seq3:493-693(-)